MEGENVQRKRHSRDNETPEEKRARLDKNNERRRLQKEKETEEEKEIRLSKDRERKRLLKEKKTDEELNKADNESFEERKVRIEAEILRSDSEKRARLDKEAENRRTLQQAETDEERRARLDRKAENRRILLEAETDEKKRERLDQDNENRRQRELNEDLELIVQRRQRNLNTSRIRIAEQQSSRSTAFQNVAENAETDESLIPENYLGELNVQCNQCLSLNFSGEITNSNKTEFSRCCQKGQVKLAPYKQFPEYFKNLMTRELPESSNFLNFIRCYNSSFAFASTGASIKPPPGNGPYCFRVCGQISHRTGALHPDNDDVRKFSQIYILDPDEAVHQRMSLPENKDCTELLMRGIEEVIRNLNPFSESIKMLHEVEKEAKAQAEEKGIEMTEVKLAILHDRSKDQRRYNAQKVNEVAVVFQSTDGEPPFERDIIMHLRNHVDNAYKTKRINILNPNLDPLTYPIFFPNGDSGWSTDLKRVQKTAHNKKAANNDEDDENEDEASNEPIVLKSRKGVSMREYFSYRLSVRNEFNPILNAGKLTQQYIVDAYIRAEANDLNYIRMNQPKLRADKYNSLVDHINNDADGAKPGVSIILPSSFQGSPRNMHQNYQDAMAIVTKFGKPDLFVTMTCNPKWKEISENLEPWQRVEHRPDLVARVFNLKLKELLDDIKCKNKSLFGEVLAIIHVIEFQKRGLPHAHILIILAKDHKIVSVEDIDRIVKAEIPDKETSPRLFEIVTRNMIHTPCGKTNPNSPCMVDNQCQKGFPKAFQKQTLGNIDGYPIYQRREDMTAFDSKGNQVDNSWVVPYNPYLSLKYNCHINVEICASVKSVKYLFKYVYKGHDCANICVEEKNAEGVIRDESKEYLDSRYVSAPEAIWRLFSFRMHEQSHAIYRLPVHLENEQSVFFHEGNEQAAIEKADLKDSKLIAWFKLNKIDSEAQEYKYWQIPVHYTWNAKKCMWNKRKRGADKVIGRMYTVNLKEGERYFLRLLLSHEKGATSYEDLRTIEQEGEKVILATFKDAAKEKGYLLDEEIWQITIDDAKTYAMPYQLRQLFAYICALGTPFDKLKLWNDNKEDLIEDFCYKSHQKQGECRHCELYALKDLKDTLCLLRCSLVNFGLPSPDCLDSLPNLNVEFYNPAEDIRKGDEMIALLNEEQRSAFETIIDSINDTTLKSKCFFLDGPGGSGKTFLYTALLHYFKGRNEICLPSASTGIAANLLLGGRTYHSLYSIPIDCTEISNSSLGMKTNDALNIKQAQLLIVDECTLASGHVMNVIDRLLQSIMNNEIPFGGKVILLGGDFRQCLAIKTHAMQAAIVGQCLKKSDNWKQIKKLSLVSNMRSVDKQYSEWLIKLGDGELKNEYDLGEDVIEIPKALICEGSLVNEIFGDRISLDMIETLSRRAILCPKNVDVDRINAEIIEIIEGESRTYISDDIVETNDESERENFTIEFLNSLNPSGMPPHRLILKVGTIIMLLRNLNTRKGLCNGTRLVVNSMTSNVIEAQVLTGSAVGDKVLIPRIDVTSSATDLPFKMRRRQFPLKASFAMTINKSQGQTLDKVGIHLSDPVFGHGQLYVAFSRVRRAVDVKVKVIETSQQGKLAKGRENIFTRNVVYREVFNL